MEFSTASDQNSHVDWPQCLLENITWSSYRLKLYKLKLYKWSRCMGSNMSCPINIKF